MAVELIAPAKVNFVLEVMGRRGDGYHEIASVMQTIDLADKVRLEEAASIQLVVAGEAQLGVPLEGPRNLAYAAAQALAEAAGRGDLGVRIILEKRIPAGLGLGGGSSDAASVLRGLDRLWGLDFGEASLSEVAANVGSDVAFLLRGGAAYVTGRGERVEALPDGAAIELTLFVAKIETEDKTRRMYATLTPADFTDGRKAHVAAESIRRGLALAETDLHNAFDRHIGEVAPPLAAAMTLCRTAGLAVLAAGSGPGFFTVAPLSQIPPLLLHELQRDWGVSALACRTLRRAEATTLREV
jgi:4-diphosphocytidyl-2-C-methyl-D-erythritol kinase